VETTIFFVFFFYKYPKDFNEDTTPETCYKLGSWLFSRSFAFPVMFLVIVVTGNLAGAALYDHFGAMGC